MTDVTMSSLREERHRTQEEYERLYAAFTRLREVWEDSAERWEVMEDIITLRASLLIDRAITGLAIDFDKALDLLREHNDFTSEHDRQRRDLLVAAIDNMVDFAAAGECAMLRELPEELEEEHFGDYDALFERYNLQWAGQENADVTFSAAMAAWWILQGMDTVLTYMTQQDERVRPWHTALEGVSYPKREFPPELIPPIEYGCRCYLQAEGLAAVTGALDGRDFISRVHPVFRESLATGGKVFSAAHLYFDKPLPPEAAAIAERLKQKFFLR